MHKSALDAGRENKLDGFRPGLRLPIDRTLWRGIGHTVTPSYGTLRQSYCDRGAWGKMKKSSDCSGSKVAWVMGQLFANLSWFNIGN